MVKKIAALLLAGMLLLTGCAAKQPAKEQNTDGAAAQGILSTFTTTDLDGNTVTAQDAFGGYEMTVVNVWGTFCSPCIAEMPDLGALSDALAEKNVRVVGIVIDALAADGSIDAAIVESAQEIVAQTGADYLHLLPSEDLLGLLSQITAVPTTLFVDETGAQVGSAYAGARSEDEWAAIVEETLEQMK